MGHPGSSSLIATPGDEGEIPYFEVGEDIPIITGSQFAIAPGVSGPSFYGTTVDEFGGLYGLFANAGTAGLG